MGNPHPTRSKPCKIGRKHTGAPSDRIRQKQRNAAKARHREVRVLGPGRREILISRAETKRQAITQLADFIHNRCMEVGI